MTRWIMTIQNKFSPLTFSDNWKDHWIAGVQWSYSVLFVTVCRMEHHQTMSHNRGIRKVCQSGTKLGCDSSIFEKTFYIKGRFRIWWRSPRIINSRGIVKIGRERYSCPVVENIVHGCQRGGHFPKKELCGGRVSWATSKLWTRNLTSGELQL